MAITSTTSQLFRPRANAIARGSIAVAVFLLIASGWAGTTLDRSPYQSMQGVVREQPVMFSHQHHAGQLGIDCRYCHTSVEQGAFAGMPSTKTCMSCHSQIWNNAPLLAPVRASWETNTPLRWQRVHNLPRYVYFDHSIHVAKGVGCATCHGPVEQMPLVYQYSSLQMEWCLTCHREPEKFLRPREKVFDQTYAAPADQAALGAQLVKAYHVHKEQLTNCYICHR